MMDQAREKARAEVQRVQSKIERAEGQLEDVRGERRGSFKRAREAGLSLAEIGKAANLHRAEFDQILRGKQPPGPSMSETVPPLCGDRISRVADVEVEGIPLKDWPMRELRRRHALALVDHMLRTEGRATTGAVGILRSLSAMAEDAITDEVCDLNPFKGIRIRANDPRAKKKRRPIRVFSFEEMHRFAKAAGRYEAMVRVFTDTGMRLGEVLPLRREDFDGETLKVRRTAHEGTILEGTKTDHGEHDAGRVVPVPATLAWMLEAQIHLNGHDCELLFTTPTRPHLARAQLLPRRLEAGPGSLRPRHPPPRVPPQLRHAPPRRRRQRRRPRRDRGHRVETMLARYTHAVGKGFETVRATIEQEYARDVPSPTFRRRGHGSFADTSLSSLESRGLAEPSRLILRPGGDCVDERLQVLSSGPRTHCPL